MGLAKGVTPTPHVWENVKRLLMLRAFVGNSSSGLQHSRARETRARTAFASPPHDRNCFTAGGRPPCVVRPGLPSRAALGWAAVSPFFGSSRSAAFARSSGWSLCATWRKRPRFISERAPSTRSAALAITAASISSVALWGASLGLLGGAADAAGLDLGPCADVGFWGLSRNLLLYRSICTGSHRLRPEQCLVIRFYGFIAFADGLLQPFDVGDLNMAP
jgi:hypothetical protein